MFNSVFEFYKLGAITCIVAGTNYNILVDICSHGTRFKTTKTLRYETEQDVFEKTKDFYFGEGFWLMLPTIEEAVLEVFGGTEEEVEELSSKYDDLLLASLPELITGNFTKGFIETEIHRLRESDLSN